MLWYLARKLRAIFCSSFDYPVSIKYYIPDILNGLKIEKLNAIVKLKDHPPSLSLFLEERHRRCGN